MLIEALKPLKVKLPTGDMHLMPGWPVDIPSEKAKQLLTKAKGKVRLVHSPMPDWLKAYRDLAVATYGLMPEDARFWPVMRAMEACDNAWRAKDWPSFEQGQALVYVILASER